MGVFTAKLGPLFVWQALVLAVVTVGAAGGAYVGFGAIDSDGAGAIAEDEQLVPAQIGDLISVVSTDGSLSFPNVESAAFETNGTVGEVLVEAGDTVTAGQALATLDASSLTTMELRVARAEVDLRDANDKLAEALEPADAQVIAKAENTIAKAELALEKAQDDLAALVDTTQAQTDVTDAEVELSTAQATLALEINEWEGKVADAKTAESDAAAAYLTAFDQWLGVPAASVDTALSPSAVLAGMGADLTVLFPTSQSDTNFYLLGGTPDNDPATAWNEATIFWYVSFFPGAIIGDCGGTTPLQGSCVSAELDAVWDILVTKRTALATAELNASKSIASATTPVTKAADSLAAAEQTLAELDSGTDTTEVTVARASVTVALADVDAAKESLADLGISTDDKDLEVLRQQVAAANNELASAKESLTGTTLTAPIAGIVTELDMFTGDSATGGQSGSITITDQSIVEIAGTVDEIDVLSISEGVLAAVELTALPDQTLRGTVTEIGSPTNNQGVVTFPVSITVDVPQGLALREGLSATASVVISQQLNVLRVPTSSINGSFLEPFVRVSDGGDIVEQPVDLGASDDFWVIVTAGLSEGDQVVMPAPSATSLDFGAITFGGANAGQVFRQLQGGGGFGGGRGGQGTGGNGTGGNGGRN
jgi:multidrug efflux pump subunit AcrA (membrane-fusion protein)